LATISTQAAGPEFLPFGILPHPPGGRGMHPRIVQMCTARSGRSPFASGRLRRSRALPARAIRLLSSCAMGSHC